MINIQLRTLLAASAAIVVCLYGSFSVLFEVLQTFLPLGGILVVVLALGAYFLRVPSPSQDAVESILGKEPHLCSDNDSVIRTIAHRGAGLDAPENSLAAFQMCKEQGIDTIELDVSLTSDGVPIIFHDDTLERMTGIDKRVDKEKWEDLKNIDISAKHVYRDRFGNTKIPTLEQAVTQLLSTGQKMIIDLKDNNLKLVKIIHNLYQERPELYSQAIVSTFFPNLIYMIRKGNPKIVCSLAWRPHFLAYESYTYPQGETGRRAKSWFKHSFLTVLDQVHLWALSRVTYYLLGLSVILLHKDAISSKTVVDWRRKGVRVMAWTVNTPAEKQYFARFLKITYLTDTVTAEESTHNISMENSFS